MCKKFLSLLIIILISQSILFSQENCEDLVQAECFESLFCNWSIVTTPNGILETCIDSNNSGWDDECSGLSQDECVDSNNCTWAGNSDDPTTWGMCIQEADWPCSDINNFYQCNAMNCEWIIDSDNPNGWGSCIEGDWEEEDECSGFSQDDCEWLDYCEWQWGNPNTGEGSCVESDHSVNVFFSGYVYGNMGPMLPAFEHLVGAIVKLYGGFTGGLLAETETNEEGYFEFDGVATAAHAYSVHANGYIPTNGNLFDLCNSPDTAECFPINANFYLDLENNNQECEGLSETECFNNSECTPNYDAAGQFEGCVVNDDGPPECALDCPGIEDIDPGQDPDGACQYIINIVEGNSAIGTVSGCIDDCDEETLDFLHELSGLCYQCLNGASDCGNIFDNNNNEDGCVDEGGVWYDYGQEIFMSDCEYLECTPNGWAGPFTLDNDACSNNNWECSDLGYEDCQVVDYCEWISDSNIDPGFGGMCVETNGGDDPFTCLMDCPGMSDLNSEEDPDGVCIWFLGLTDSECIVDCNEEVYSMLSAINEVCTMCLDGMFECSDIFDDEGDDGGGDDGGDDGPPECLMDCEGIYDVDPDEDPDATCEWLIETLSPNNECTSDCEAEELIGLIQLSGLCEECLTGVFDCGNIFDDDDNDCDPYLMCAQVETCVDGLLYPTACGPDNCDGPIGECNGGANDGILYGYVEYIWGDVIEMVPNTNLIIQSINTNDWNETYQIHTDGNGYYEISLPEGEYIVTAYAYDDSETQNIYIENGHEHELNFQLGEWSWPEPQAVLSLGNGIGTQEGFTVPLYLHTETPASGLQFMVRVEYTGGGFWFTPSNLESINDCFTANFSDVYSQLSGIMFSLEGCVYEPGEHHVANLSFTVTEGSSTILPGTDVHLVFAETIVSDPGANEIPSSGEGSMVTFGQLGDVNSDGAINVLDIVNMVNFVLQIDEPTEYELWAADLNQDGIINVLDVVSGVNIILYEDGLQRSDSGVAEIYHNEKEVHIKGIDVAGFQIEFSDDIDVNQIQIPEGWVSNYYGNFLLAYALDGNLLNGCSIIQLNQSTEIVELIVVDANGESIMASINTLPNIVSLKGNFPNPFNPETSIAYTLSHEAKVILSVYDLSGRLVETLIEGQQYPGEFLVSWSAHSLPSGMYIARLIVDGESFTQKMILMK